MPLAKTIDEVILQLDEIIAESIQKNSRLGYFACLYRKMTVAVKQGIINGSFEDGPRMECLDVQFANRYLNAYHQYKNGQQATTSWQRAFEATEQPYTVIQHLLLGMNAHINLDLGISAAEISTGTDIHLLQKDFDTINVVISSLINVVQTDLEDICFPMRFVRFIDNKSKDAVINFSISTARKTAWANALALSALPAVNHLGYIQTLDIQIACVAKNILTPKISQSLLLKMVQLFEPKNAGKIIACLKD